MRILERFVLLVVMCYSSVCTANEGFMARLSDVRTNLSTTLLTNLDSLMKVGRVF